MTKTPPQAVCAKCAFCKHHTLPKYFYTTDWRCLKSPIGYSPITGHTWYEKCYTINADGECKMFRKQVIWPFNMAYAS